MDIEIVCKACKQHINVDSQATGQAFNCPTCNQPLKVPKVPVFPESAHSPMFCPPTKTTTIDIACAPSAGVKHFDEDWRSHGFCSVWWYQPIWIARQKRIQIKTTNLREISHRKEDGICYVTFDIPEDVICYYNRYLGTRSRAHESAFFRVTNGTMEVLSLGKSDDLIPLFMKEYDALNLFDWGQKKQDLRLSVGPDGTCSIQSIPNIP